MPFTFGRRLGRAGLAAALVVCFAATGAAQTGGYTGSIYFVTIDTADGEQADAVYILNSLDVEHGRLRASATLPWIVQRSAWAVEGDQLLDVPWQSGFADPTFRVEVEAWRTRARDAALRLSASVKAPVASVEDGFSSGEVDYALGVSWSAFRNRQSVLADFTWWVLGDPSDVDYRNVASFYVGYGRVLDRRYRWSAIVSASGAPSVIPGGTPPAQVSVALLRGFGARGALGVSFDVGLTDGAADLGVGTTFRFAF